MQQAYPFEPKSSARLRPGDFWDIVLTNGAHAAGVVVAVPSEADDPMRGKPSTREFVAGLLDWTGASQFVPEVEGRQALLDWGHAHVKVITSGGGKVLGNVGLELTKLRRRSHDAGSPMWLYENGIYLRGASEEEARSFPVASVYGYNYIQLLAERAFVQRLPLTR